MGEVSGPVSYVGWKILAIFALIAANATFVSMEFALVASRHTKLEEMARKGNRVARLALQQMEHRSLYIASVQLGITLASLALGWIGDVTIASLVQPPLEGALGARFSLVVAHSVGTVISFTVISFLHIVLGEQVPKIFTISNPERVILTLARPVGWFTWLFGPFIWLLDKATLGVLFVAGQKKANVQHSAHNIEELKLLLKESQESGILEQQEQQMLMRVFDFKGRSVSEVMIPRPDIVGVEDDATVEDVLQVYGAMHHNLYPVYHDDLDHIRGIIVMDDIFHHLIADNSIRQAKLLSLDLLRRPLLVPETKPIGPLFAEMRRKHIPVAIAIDEYGGTAGLVTLEDLVEEVMGQLSEEWESESEPGIRVLGQGVYEIQAQLRVDEVDRELGLNIPEGEEYETVAGYLLYRLGHIPEEGETYNDYELTFTVTEMRGPKIVRIRIEKHKTENKEENR